jgi:hypothetical protein
VIRILISHHGEVEIQVEEPPMKIWCKVCDQIVDLKHDCVPAQRGSKQDGCAL